METVEIVLQHDHRGRRVDVIALLARAHARRGERLLGLERGEALVPLQDRDVLAVS